MTIDTIMNSSVFSLLVEKNIFTPLDVHFASFMTRLAENAGPELFLAAALTSKCTLEGHTCLDLSTVAGKPLLKEQSSAWYSCPDLLSWLAILKQSPVVGKPDEFKPLILDDTSRLYLFRYWEYEKNLAEGIKQRARTNAADIDLPLLSESLERYFPQNKNQSIDWQKVAAATSVLKKFSVISGGPGTGKTFTVIKILALLLEQAKNKKLRIALAAPTGKGAARLQEAVKHSKKMLPSPENIKEAIPDEASTIHRLLGTIADSPYFRHNAQNRLPLDVIVVDEVSMVPLSLMAKVNEAVPDDAWMILLGDKDQLASVEPGSVLGDICDSGHAHGFSRHHRDLLTQVSIDIQSPDDTAPGMQDAIVHLQKSYRFEKDSGISELSAAINEGDGNRALSLLKSGRYPAITWKNLPAAKNLPLFLKDTLLSGLREYFNTQDPKNALPIFEQHRILCALREGPYGVRYLNGLVEHLLKKERGFSHHLQWYSGRPVMITRNDYNVRLFNGDVGIVLPDRENSGELRAYFPDQDGTMRKFNLLRLPEHETVYALTIHKSQGSEFDEILLILPDTPSPVVTRELIYTAITRAKKRVEIWGNEEVFQAAVKTRIARTSGLRDALWGT